MGVFTHIDLEELNTLFEDFSFVSLEGISAGLIDSTYTASTHKKAYILKKHEGAIKKKIQQHIQLLEMLYDSGLNVPRCLDAVHPWYLYDKLKGEMPKLTKTYHIQALARFLAQMHKRTYKQKSLHNFYESYTVDVLLYKLKSKYFGYYKKLSSLKDYTPSHDGIIHGDIFRDNTVFYEQKIGVFDFIDAGNGSFVLDVAIALLGFELKRKDIYFIKLFLKTYNQRAPKKLEKSILLQEMLIASKFYALLRIEHHKSTTEAKELL